MNQPDPSGSGEPIAKRTRANTKKFRIDQEQIANILKLDIDCFEELFDYLPFNDLVNMGKTCKRLHRLAGYCFQQNYLGCAAHSNRYRGIVGCCDTLTSLDDFPPFIREINTFRADDFEHLLNVSSKLQQLKRINLSQCMVIDRLKEMSINNVEFLYLDRCHLNSYFHEVIDHCQKLRRLHVSNCLWKGESSDNSWLNRKYPTLQYLGFLPCGYGIGDIATVLELNPNIREFKTRESILVKNRDRILSANIKLDILAVEVVEHQGEPKNKFYELLNELHERRFYKNLHLYFGVFPENNQESVNQLATVNGLVRLSFYSVMSQSFGELKNLEDLHIWKYKSIVGYEILANELINLRRLYLSEYNIDEIMGFIRKSVKIHTIRMGFYCKSPTVKNRTVPYFNGDTRVIDLLALNRVREKLPNAQKITLYVEEEIYLATKWAVGEIDLRLIRLKRLNMNFIKSLRDEFF